MGQAHDHVVVLGIGGSALGARALLTALRRPAWNEWDDEGRDFFPRLTVLDNVLLAIEGLRPAKFVMWRPLSSYNDMYDKAHGLLELSAERVR